MSKTKVICEYCKAPFLKENKEINRANKLGGKHICSRTCNGRYAVSCNNGPAVGFGFYITLCRKTARLKNLDCNIDAVYLKELFDSQDGKCAISGIQMTMNRARAKKDKKSPYYASVDRIDNKKGYIRGNVQLVCLGINYMRNTFSIEKTKEFLQAIRIHQ